MRHVMRVVSVRLILVMEGCAMDFCLARRHQVRGWRGLQGQLRLVVVGMRGRLGVMGVGMGQRRMGREERIRV